MRQAAALGRLEDTLLDIGLTRAELGFLIDAPAGAGRQFETMPAAAGADLADTDPILLRPGALGLPALPLRRALRARGVGGRLPGARAGVAGGGVHRPPVRGAG